MIYSAAMLGAGGLGDLGYKGLCEAGDAAAEMRDTPTAVRCFEEAVALRRTPYSLVRLAAVLRDAAAYERAIEYARAAIALDPDSRWARTVLVAALCDLERWDDAEREGRAAVERCPDDLPVLQMRLRAAEGQLSVLRASEFPKLAPQAYAVAEQQVRASRRLLDRRRARERDRACEPATNRGSARRPLVYAEAVRRMNVTIDPTDRGGVGLRGEVDARAMLLAPGPSVRIGNRPAADGPRTTIGRFEVSTRPL